MEVKHDKKNSCIAHLHRRSHEYMCASRENMHCTLGRWCVLIGM